MAALAYAYAPSEIDKTTPQHEELFKTWPEITTHICNKIGAFPRVDPAAAHRWGCIPCDSIHIKEGPHFSKRLIYGETESDT